MVEKKKGEEWERKEKEDIKQKKGKLQKVQDKMKVNKKGENKKL